MRSRLKRNQRGLQRFTFFTHINALPKFSALGRRAAAASRQHDEVSRDYPSITRLQARKGRQQFHAGLMEGQNLRRQAGRRQSAWRVKRRAEKSFNIFVV